MDGTGVIGGVVRGSTSMTGAVSGIMIVGATTWLCSAWICRQTAAADSPIPFSVTSSRAMAVSMSSSSSSACSPSRQNFPSMASDTSCFLRISRRQLDCIVLIALGAGYNTKWRRYAL